MVWQKMIKIQEIMRVLQKLLISASFSQLSFIISYFWFKLYRRSRTSEKNGQAVNSSSLTFLLITWSAVGEV
jgi:hypothetical protein